MNCTFDTSGCFRCGDGQRNLGEDCDPPGVQAQCQSGEICAAGCGSCTSLCNNGQHEVGEPCDRPGQQDQCPSGQVCAADCGSCIPSGTGVCNPNGIVDGNEQCDPMQGPCCNANCQLSRFGTECRAAAGFCDLAETCNGSSASCPADIKDTTQCRPVAGSCDRPEVCNGVDNDCPANVFLPASTVCRTAAGLCDVIDTCSGNSASCPDVKSTVECRSAMGPCDTPDICNGTSNDCPDQFLSAGTVCRPKVGQCDIAEMCDGLSTTCPTNDMDECALSTPCTGGQVCVFVSGSCQCSD